MLQNTPRRMKLISSANQTPPMEECRLMDSRFVWRSNENIPAANKLPFWHFPPASCRMIVPVARVCPRVQCIAPALRYACLGCNYLPREREPRATGSSYPSPCPVLDKLLPDAALWREGEGWMKRWRWTGVQSSETPGKGKFSFQSGWLPNNPRGERKGGELEKKEG